MKRILNFDRIFIVIFTIWSLFPIYWLVGNSLKKPIQIETLPPHWIPDFTLRAYRSILDNPAMVKTFRNSFIVASSSTLIAILIGTLAGFALGQLVTKRHVNYEFWVLSSRMVPSISVALPFFIVFQFFKIQDTLIGLILAHTTMLIGLVTWILIETFRGIPREIHEAAQIDGCSYRSMFRKIMLPLARTGIVGAATISFLLSWNEFFLSLVLTSSRALTVQVILYQAIGYQTFDLGQLAATSVVVLIPTILVVTLFQHQLVRGLTMGSVKG